MNSKKRSVKKDIRAIVSLALSIMFLINMSASFFASDDYKTIEENSNEFTSFFEEDSEDFASLLKADRNTYASLLEEYDYDYEGLSIGDLTEEQLTTAILSSNDIPDMISDKVVAEKGHVNRLREQEPDLYFVLFQNRDATKSGYIFSQSVKYNDEDGIARDKQNVLTSIENETYKDYLYFSPYNEIKTYYPKILVLITGEPNCLGYTVFDQGNLGLWILNSSKKTIDHTTGIEQTLDDYSAYRYLGDNTNNGHSATIYAGEHRIAFRVPNDLYGSGVIFHVIYQLSDGRWVGKNHMDPSKGPWTGNPSITPVM